MKITEKVAYIRGLAEGLELDPSQKEVKVLNAIIDLLDEMAETLTDVHSDLQDVAAQLDEVDEDLGSLEEEVYGGECTCGCEHDDADEEDDDEPFGEDDCYYEVTCPNCNETICLSEDVICVGQMDCPNCGVPLEFDIDDCEEDDCEEDDSCGCGCGCDHHHDDEE